MRSPSAYLSSSQKAWLPLKYHPWLALSVGGCVFLVCVLAAMLKKPIFQSEGKLQIENQSAVSKLSGLQEDINKPGGLSDLSNPTITELEAIQSLPVLEKTIRQLNLRDSNGTTLTPKGFLEHLTVSEIKGADILAVQYKDPNPQTAASVVNTLMQVYLATGKQRNRDDIVAASRFLEDELPRVEKAVQQAGTKLQQFKQAYQIGELQEKAKSSETQLNTLNAQITEARAQLADVTAQSQELLAKLGMTAAQAIAATTLSQSSEIQNIVNQIQQTETRLIQERERLTDEHPQVRALQNNLDELEKKYQARSQIIAGKATVDHNSLISLQRQNLTTDLVKLEATRQGLIQKIKDLSTSLNQYQQQQLANLPRLEQQQRELAQRLTASQSTYARLLQQKQEVQLQIQQASIHARILSHATTPTEPVEPRRLLYLITGLLLGSLLAYGSAYLAESLNQSLRTTSEARHLFANWRILGIIPIFGRPRNIFIYEGDPPVLTPGVIVRDQPNTPASEAFRRLQVTLCALQKERPVKSVVVTSAIEREGKSTVCANIAAAIAQAGQQVLLIDANLPHPYQHELWEIPNDLGLTNLLIAEVSTEDVIQSGINRLDVITAGTPVDHPAVLMKTECMAAILQKFVSYYDWILIDTPAINRSADALLWGNVADSTLLTVRPPLLDQVNAALARDTLEMSQQSLLGIVINASDKERRDYQYLGESDDFAGRSLQPSDVKRLPEKTQMNTLSTPSKERNGSALYSSGIEEDGENVSLFDMPIKALVTLVAELQQEWEQSTQVTLELEEEHQLQEKLLHQLEAQRKLAQQLQSVTLQKSKELTRLETRYAEEYERLKLVDATLSNQRKNLEQQQIQWEQAASILTTRQQNMTSV
jgi:capsular exopolysaccharide synthesis family protein